MSRKTITYRQDGTVTQWYHCGLFWLRRRKKEVVAYREVGAGGVLRGPHGTYRQCQADAKAKGARAVFIRDAEVAR